MRDDDALFTLFKRGWQMNIVPRRAAGWWATIWWTIPLAMVTAGFVWIMANHPGRGTIAAAVLLYLLLVLGWSIGFIQWAKARSVVVDLGRMDKANALKALLDKDRRPASGE